MDGCMNGRLRYVVSNIVLYVCNNNVRLSVPFNGVYCTSILLLIMYSCQVILLCCDMFDVSAKNKSCDTNK